MILLTSLLRIHHILTVILPHLEHSVLRLAITQENTHTIFNNLLITLYVLAFLMEPLLIGISTELFMIEMQ